MRNLSMLCLALIAGLGSAYGTEPASPGKADGKNDKARVRLRDQPALRKPISGEFRDPKPQDIVDLVRKGTEQRLSLDASVIQDRPLQGHTLLRGIPAWAALENLAQNQYIKGYWTKRGDEYVLMATYSGKPPPVPPQPPPHLRKAMDRAEKGLPPAPLLEKPLARRFGWLFVISTTVLFLLLFLVRWRSGIDSPTTSNPPLSEDSK